MTRAGGPATGLVIVLASGVSGCDSWPRSRHLPDVEPAFPADQNPRHLVAVPFEEVTPPQRVDQPPGAPLGELPAERGFLVEGTLVGTGWADDGVPASLVGAACGSEGTRAPVAGDYVGDASVYGFESPVDGVLCARLLAGDPDTGLDLLLYTIDDCGVPTGLVTAGEQPVGAGGVGPVWEWSAPISGGQRYAVLVAAYAPRDEERALNFRLGLSMRGESPALCPVLPEERP